MSWLPEWLSRALTPKSTGEVIVDQIYGGAPSRTLEEDPYYDPDNLSEPHVYTQAKGAVKDAVGSLRNYAFIAVAVIIAVVLVHAFILSRGMR